MSDDTLPADHADDDLGAEELDGTTPFVADVRVQGAVRVQSLAVDLPVMRSITLTSTVETVAPLDPRRSRLVLHSDGSQSIYVGVSRAEVDAGTAFLWKPAGPLLLEIRGRRAVFAKVAAAGQAAPLSFLVEQLG